MKYITISVFNMLRNFGSAISAVVSVSTCFFGIITNEDNQLLKVYVTQANTALHSGVIRGLRQILYNNATHHAASVSYTHLTLPTILRV